MSVLYSLPNLKYTFSYFDRTNFSHVKEVLVKFVFGLLNGISGFH